MNNYLVNGNQVSVAPEGSMSIFGKLPAGRYTIEVPPMGSPYLQRVPELTVPGKIYGDTSIVDRVVKTYLDRTDRNTGVLFHGVRGSGKSVTAKLIANKLLHEYDIPIVMLDFNQISRATLSVIEDIDCPCVVFIDELDKVREWEQTDMLLGVLDGTSVGSKLFICTANDLYEINKNMLNRPGRIYYSVEFGTLTDAQIREYCEDNLLDSSDSIVRGILQVSRLVEGLTFDLLSSLVEELNRFGGDPLEVAKILNIEVDLKGTYTLNIFDKNNRQIQLSGKYDSWWLDFDPSDGCERISYYVNKAGDPMTVDSFDPDAIDDTAEFRFFDYCFDGVDDSGNLYYLKDDGLRLVATKNYKKLGKVF